MLGGVALALGVQSSGTTQVTDTQNAADDPASAVRDRGEIDDLASHGAAPQAAPTVVPMEPIMPVSQPPVQPSAPKPPSRYAQWAEEKYMRALESPQMVQSFHGAGTLEIASANVRESDSSASDNLSEVAISIHPAARSVQLIGMDRLARNSDQDTSDYRACDAQRARQESERTLGGDLGGERISGALPRSGHCGEHRAFGLWNNRFDESPAARIALHSRSARSQKQP